MGSFEALISTFPKNMCFDFLLPLGGTLVLKERECDSFLSRKARLLCIISLSKEKKQEEYM